MTGAERWIVVVSAILAWFLAWAHPLMPPDEGRYGSVSARMVESGNWLVPEFQGRAHLTKPPLTYWLQAVGISALGRTELAVRWPSLLATSIGLLVLFGFARRTLGTRPAVIAVAMAGVMPYVLVVGRLANTDALLACSWLVALASGYRLVTEPEADRRARLLQLVLFWGATGVGFLTKREVALGPILILGAWIVLGRGGPRRLGDLARLRPLVGAPLALLPFAVWTGLILARHPGAAQIWWDETIGRVTGEKDLRTEPWWFYVPIFLAGMYPATTMLTLPIVNLRPGDALRAFTGGDLRAYLLIAVLFPFLGFSASSGKLATYLLPLAPPTAMLAAITVERWLRGELDQRRPGLRPPDVRITLAICACLVFAVEFGAAVAVREAVPDLWPFVLPMAFAPLGCLVCWGLWRRGLVDRARGLGLAWFGLAVSWTLTFAIETRFAAPMGAGHLLAYLERHVDLRQPDILLLGFVDPTIEFYNGRPVRSVASLKAIDALEDLRTPAVLLIDGKLAEDTLEDALKLAEKNPASVANRLDPLGATWTRWFNRPTRVALIRAPERRPGTSGNTGGTP